MSGRGEIRYVFTSSNTYHGFRSFIPELIKPLQRAYILKGAPGTGKSTLIRMLGESLANRGYAIDFWLSASDPLNPEGVYLPRLEIAVVNGSLGLSLDPRYPGVTGEIIHLEQFQDRTALRLHGREIIELVDRLEAENEQAFQIMKNAAGLKEELKKNASSRLKMEKINQLIDRLEDELFKESPAERHFYASAYTAEGTINYVDEISRNCQRRYILKGPPGSAKSTIISEMARRGRERGWYMEYYHCGLDLESLVMLIIPSQGIALIDAGNAELSLRPWDVVIDMNTCLEPLDSSPAQSEDTQANRAYETLLSQAQIQFDNAYKTLKELKKIYGSVMDFAGLDEKREELLQEIIASS